MTVKILAVQKDQSLPNMEYFLDVLSKIQVIIQIVTILNCYVVTGQSDCIHESTVNQTIRSISTQLKMFKWIDLGSVSTR